MVVEVDDQFCFVYHFCILAMHFLEGRMWYFDIQKIIIHALMKSKFVVQEGYKTKLLFISQIQFQTFVLIELTHHIYNWVSIG
jgi:hypothetical protein